MILGRKDNVINSGGIKIQAEEMEKRLQSLIDVPFVITSVPDRRLGQAVTLLIEGRLHLTAIEGRIQAVLEPYYRPKYIRMVNHIPRTEMVRLIVQSAAFWHRTYISGERKNKSKGR